MDLNFLEGGVEGGVVGTSSGSSSSDSGSKEGFVRFPVSLREAPDAPEVEAASFTPLSEVIRCILLGLLLFR